jgi:hypothetical protein
MTRKMDFTRAEQDRRITTYGHEPIAKDYAEFPPKYSEKARRGPRPPSAQEWIDGQQNPRNPVVRLRYLLVIEQAFRRGEQPRIPRIITERLAPQIEAIRMNPEVRKAYHDAVNRKKGGSLELPRQQHPGRLQPSNRRR